MVKRGLKFSKVAEKLDIRKFRYANFDTLISNYSAFKVPGATFRKYLI